MLRSFVIVLFLLLCAACPIHTGTGSFFSDNKKLYNSSACNPKKPFPQMIVLPFFESASQIVLDCKVYPKHQTSLAMMVFYEYWVDNFGDHDQSVKKMLQSVMIEWGLKKKKIPKAYNISGGVIVNPTIVGMVKSKSMIWVWKGYDNKIANSSLAHELVHLALRAKNGHGDSDHEGYKYRGWTQRHTYIIKQINKALLSFNI